MCDLASNNCGNGCGCGNNSCIWIILILLFCCGNNGIGSSDCGCGNDNSCIWIILILLFCGGLGNNSWGGCGNSRDNCRDNCGCC